MVLLTLLVLLLLPASTVLAQESVPLERYSQGFHLSPTDTDSQTDTDDNEGGPPYRLRAGVFSAGVVLGSAANAFSESPRRDFHVTRERFFQRDTYAGGADKASHFVDYAILSKELQEVYERFGLERTTSIWLGFGVATAAGLMTEIGDGTTFFGFSYEDFVMDTLGAGTAGVIVATRTQDLFGFRRGFLLPPSGSDTCCPVQGKGRDYSNEIQTADLKLAGVARRLGVNVGPLRYLLVSLTYGTKGYPSGLPELRERQAGIEIGLNFEAILDDVGVTRATWWGYALHVVFDNIRVPFTAIGVRYDLNHDRWRGPDNGHTFPSR
jgi:hypothetical protein